MLRPCRAAAAMECGAHLVQHCVIVEPCLAPAELTATLDALAKAAAQRPGTAPDGLAMLVEQARAKGDKMGGLGDMGMGGVISPDGKGGRAGLGGRGGGGPPHTTPPLSMHSATFYAAQLQLRGPYIVPPLSQATLIAQLSSRAAVVCTFSQYSTRASSYTTPRHFLTSAPSSNRRQTLRHGRAGGRGGGGV